MIDFANSMLSCCPLAVVTVYTVVPVSCRSVMSLDSCDLMNSVTKNIVDTVTLVGDWVLALLLDLMGIVGFGHSLVNVQGP